VKFLKINISIKIIRNLIFYQLLDKNKTVKKGCKISPLRKFVINYSGFLWLQTNLFGIIFDYMLS